MKVVESEGGLRPPKSYYAGFSVENGDTGKYYMNSLIRPYLVWVRLAMVISSLIDFPTGAE